MHLLFADLICLLFPYKTRQLVTHQADVRKMASLLISLGVSPVAQSILFPSDQYLDVFLDGTLFFFFLLPS
jgi:hypothetical protein